MGKENKTTRQSTEPVNEFGRELAGVHNAFVHATFENPYGFELLPIVVTREFAAINGINVSNEKITEIASQLKYDCPLWSYVTTPELYDMLYDPRLDSVNTSNAASDG